MTSNEPRTTDQIRKEIVEERAQLDEKLAVLGAEAKRSGRIAGSALAALGGATLVVKLLARRRGR